MKSKKFNKKLSLNKSTVTHLTPEELTKAPGGYEPTVNSPGGTCHVNTCNTYCGTCGNTCYCTVWTYCGQPAGCIGP